MHRGLTFYLHSIPPLFFESLLQEQARLQVLQEWTEKLERQQRQAEAEQTFRRRMNSWPKILDYQQVQFMNPSQVLHPNMPPQYQQQQMPTQLPMPGQQFGQGQGQGQGRNMMMMTGGQPLSNPSAWSASPIYPTTMTTTATATPTLMTTGGHVIDIRRPAFATYRG
jgi:hypothetical protein